MLLDTCQDFSKLELDRVLVLSSVCRIYCRSRGPLWGYLGRHHNFWIWNLESLRVFKSAERASKTDFMERVISCGVNERTESTLGLGCEAGLFAIVRRSFCSEICKRGE